MKLKLKLLFINIVLLVVGFLTIHLFFSSIQKDDLSEIKENINIREEIYRSPSSFGGDRLSIYEFDLKDVRNIRLFKNSSEYSYFSDYVKSIESLDNLISAENNTSEENKNEILNKIDTIMQEKDVKYLIVDDKDNGVNKIYLYSKNLNKGYCIYLKY